MSKNLKIINTNGSWHKRHLILRSRHVMEICVYSSIRGSDLSGDLRRLEIRIQKRETLRLPNLRSLSSEPCCEENVLFTSKIAYFPASHISTGNNGKIARCKVWFINKKGFWPAYMSNFVWSYSLP